MTADLETAARNVIETWRGYLHAGYPLDVESVSDAVDELEAALSENPTPGD